MATTASTTKNPFVALFNKVRSICKQEPTVVVGVIVAALSAAGVVVLPATAALVTGVVAVLGGTVTVRHFVTPANIESILKYVVEGVAPQASNTVNTVTQAANTILANAGVSTTVPVTSDLPVLKEATPVTVETVAKDVVQDVAPESTSTVSKVTTDVNEVLDAAGVSPNTSIVTDVKAFTDPTTPAQIAQAKAQAQNAEQPTS